MQTSYMKLLVEQWGINKTIQVVAAMAGAASLIGIVAIMFIPDHPTQIECEENHYESYMH